MAIVWLLLASTIFSILNAALTCNQAEFTISTTTQTIPTDVCYSTQSSANGVTTGISYWYQCENDQVYMNQYLHKDCLGDAVKTQFATTYQAYSPQQACNLSPCEYATVRKVSGVWTDCTDPSTMPDNMETFSETPYIQNKCYVSGMSSSSWSCSNDGSQVTLSTYSNIECTGAATTVTVNTNEWACSGTATSGIPQYVTCGTASFSGNPATLPPVPATTPVPINQCTNTNLNCKAIEWDINGITTAYPLDVCFSVEVTTNDATTAVSYWYKCRNGVPYISTYQQADCEGNAVESSFLSLYPLSAWVTVCCDLEPCKYAVQKTYTSIDTDCTDPSTVDLTAYSSIPFVEGYCNAVNDLASWKWSCDTNGDEAMNEYFMGNGDCSGNATLTLYDTKMSVSCEDMDGQVAASAAVNLQCGVASFNDANNPGLSKTPTPSSPSAITTPCPVVGCVNGNNGNMKCGVCVWMYGLIILITFSIVTL